MTAANTDSNINNENRVPPEVPGAAGKKGRSESASSINKQHTTSRQCEGACEQV